MNPVMCLPFVHHDWQPAEPGFHQATFRIPLGTLELNAGRYSFIVLLQEKSSQKNLARVQGLAPFTMQADAVHWATIVRQAPEAVIT
jgi:hypothetical protein